MTIQMLGKSNDKNKKNQSYLKKWKRKAKAI